MPVLLSGHMLLNSASVFNTDIATARGPIEFGLYEDRENNSNILNLVAAGALAAFTPTAASLRQILATSAPVYLAPGIYWLVLKNNNTTSTFGLGFATAGTMAQSNAQTKTLTTAALPATLDFVAVTWAKAGLTAGLRLNGRVFGQATTF